MENTKSLRERVIAGLEERRMRILEGKLNCIPSPFKRFSNDFIENESSEDTTNTDWTVELK